MKESTVVLLFLIAFFAIAAAGLWLGVKGIQHSLKK